MSRHEYLVSRELAKADPPFYALLMAAYRKADTTNTAKLEAAWPELCEETKRRYWAAGAVLSTDPEFEEVKAALLATQDQVEQERAGELTEL